LAKEHRRKMGAMASDRPEAAYAAWLLERQDTLQAEANRLTKGVWHPEMLLIHRTTGISTFAIEK
jgi:hypothetical protein